MENFVNFIGGTFGHDLSFWITVGGATLVKLLTSPHHSFFRAVAMVFSAVFFAWAFTDSVVHWFNLEPDIYTIPMAAIITITGEGFMRAGLHVINNPHALIELLKAWRGK